MEVGEGPFEPWRNGFYALAACQERDALGDMVCLMTNDMTVWLLQG